MAESFRDGLKWVDGRSFEPLVMKRNKSKRTPEREPYKTIFWADGFTSCNCKGWGTHRHCEHTTTLEREVESGYLGNGVRDIRALAILQRGEVFRQLPRSRPRPQRGSAEYEIEPKVAPPIHAEALDGNPVTYRRIRL